MQMFNIKEFIKWSIREGLFTGVSENDIDNLDHNSCKFISMCILTYKKIDFNNVLSLDKKVCYNKSAIYKFDIIKNTNRAIPMLFESLV